MQNLGVMKKMKFVQEGPMYAHNDFHTSACMHTAAIKAKRASVLDLISEATYI